MESEKLSCDGDKIDGFVVLGIIEKENKHGKVIGQAVIKDLIKFQLRVDNQ